MKTKIILLFAILMGAFIIQSCEDSNILDITESFEYEQEITVLTTDSVFSYTEVVDLTEHSDVIAQYSDKIKEIQIEEVQYWLTVFGGTENQELVISKLSVADETGAGEELISQVENQNLMALLDNPTVLGINQGGVDRMAQLIKDAPHKFKLIYDVEANQKPLNFTVKFKFKIKMVANPLN